MATYTVRVLATIAVNAGSKNEAASVALDTVYNAANSASGDVMVTTAELKDVSKVRL